jgi:hypothetical protein
MRVLVLSASVGAGHVRAAEAVEAALQRRGRHVRIANCDVLTLMSPAFRRVYRDGYFEMVKRAPQPGPDKAARSAPEGSLEGWRRCDRKGPEGMASDIRRPF